MKAWSTTYMCRGQSESNIPQNFHPSKFLTLLYLVVTNPVAISIIPYYHVNKSASFKTISLISGTGTMYTDRSKAYG